MHAAALTLLLFSMGLCDDCQNECRCKGVRRQARTEGHRGQPQTCYAPRFGCYDSNNRHMNRYPAFHGVYYRRPYNYRNLFDYPWHAGLHEPTSHFSYNVPGEEVVEPKTAAPPTPPKDADASTAGPPDGEERDDPPGAALRPARLRPIPAMLQTRLDPQDNSDEEAAEEPDECPHEDPDA